MWLVEKSPTPGRIFFPVNLDNVAWIDTDESESGKASAICFNFIFTSGHDNGKQWIKWWFDDKEQRNKYLNKIHEALPKINLGIDDITL